MELPLLVELHLLTREGREAEATNLAMEPKIAVTDAKREYGTMPICPEIGMKDLETYARRYTSSLSTMRRPPLGGFRGALLQLTLTCKLCQ